MNIAPVAVASVAAELKPREAAKRLNRMAYQGGQAAERIRQALAAGAGAPAPPLTRERLQLALEVLEGRADELLRP